MVLGFPFATFRAPVGNPEVIFECGAAQRIVFIPIQTSESSHLEVGVQHRSFHEFLNAAAPAL
jgi:hypothetical protein